MKNLIRLFTLITLIAAGSTTAKADISCGIDKRPKTVGEVYKIAEAYELGRCVVLNKEVAFKYYETIARDGYAPAQYKLGEMYFTGYIPKFGMDEKDKVPPHYKNARYWFLQAAKQDHGKAQLRLGLLYSEKHFSGIKPNFQQAELWLKEATRKNVEDAAFRLGNFYHNYKKPRDYDKAFKWLSFAAKNGHRVAQYDLASFYLGKGNTVRTTSKWMHWIKKAAEQEHLHAMMDLSNTYRHGGNDFSKDEQKSIKWAIKVANKNKSTIWYNRIADALINGSGNLPRNRNEAIKWYIKSANKGDKYAETQLMQMDD